MSRFLVSVGVLVCLASSSAYGDELADLKAFALSVKGEFLDYKFMGRSMVTLPTSATDADLAALAELKPQKLTALVLDDCTHVTDAGFQALKGMPGLTNVSLPPRLTDKALEGLADRLPAIRLVHIRGEKVGPFDPSPITTAGVASLAKLKSLDVLTISDAAVDDDMFAPLAEVSTLKTLTVERCPKLTGSGLKRLAACKKLITLSVSECPLSAGAQKEIGELQSLQYLTLAKCALTDEGAAAFARLTDLRDVVFQGDAITDAALRPLGALPKLFRVSVIDVPIGDTGLQHLAGLKALELVSLGKSKVTDAGVAKFHEARPKVKVSRY